MRSVKIVLCCLLWVVAACSSPQDPPPETPGAAFLFEGARLIVGDGSALLENAAFLVENGRFADVGVAGKIALPAGGVRVDLTGKTVMPAIINTHVHPGYADVIGMTNVVNNYSRERLVDHLNRMAYYGIAAALSLGTDWGDIPFQLREETIPGAALFRTAGPGIAIPNGGPAAADRRHKAYGVTTADEARRAVQELAARNVDIVKIWVDDTRVDDRKQPVGKLTPPLYQAIIDEAHTHGLRVVAHIVYLEDAKGLLRAGVDGFAHTVRDRDVDDELMELLAKRPDVFQIPNLPNSRLRTEADLLWLSETTPAKEIDRMREELAIPPPVGLKATPAAFQVQARNLARLRAAGVRIGLGTDGPGVGWDAHEEMADMVAAGMTPAEVIVAATSTSAGILKLDQLGTVASGKSADFIVLDANPLDDITNTRRIASVYLRGQKVDRAAMRD